MVDVSPKVANGTITLPLDLVRRKEFVAFRYTDCSGTVPVVGLHRTGREVSYCSELL